MDDLALQVGFVDDVELDDADGAHAGCGQIQQCRRAQPACADDQYLGVLEPLLSVDAEVGDDQVPAVARDLFARQLGGWFDQRRQRRHRYAPRLTKSRAGSITPGKTFNGNPRPTLALGLAWRD